MEYRWSNLGGKANEERRKDEKKVVCHDRHTTFSALRESFFVKSSTPEVFSRFVNYNARKKQQGQQVWNSHKGIEDVCQIPYEVKAYHGTEIGGDKENDTVGVDCVTNELILLIAIHLAGLPTHVFVGKVFHATLSVVAPSENGGEGKGERAEGQQRFANIWNLGERHLGKHATIRHVDVGICYD